MAKPKKAGKSEKSGAASEAPRDLDILREMISLLESSSAATIRLERGDAKYEVSRAGTTAGHALSSVPSVPSMPALPAAPSVPATPATPSTPSTPSNLIDIKSPMVGTFYRSPEPGAEPYVKVGSRVSAGQTLCIIEAMKIMNELEAEVNGVIREILVEDAQPVEFGQVLFRVDPNG